MSQFISINNIKKIILRTFEGTFKRNETKPFLVEEFKKEIQSNYAGIFKEVDVFEIK
jgi:hypothetical protein